MSSNTDMSVTPVYELSLAGLFSTSKPIMMVEEVFKEESTTETANSKNEIENTESYVLFDENLVNKVQAEYLTFVNYNFSFDNLYSKGEFGIRFYFHKVTCINK